MEDFIMNQELMIPVEVRPLVVNARFDIGPIVIPGFHVELVHQGEAEVTIAPFQLQLRLTRNHAHQNDGDDDGDDDGDNGDNLDGDKNPIEHRGWMDNLGLDHNPHIPRGGHRGIGRGGGRAGGRAGGGAAGPPRGRPRGPPRGRPRGRPPGRPRGRGRAGWYGRGRRGGQQIPPYEQPDEELAGVPPEPEQRGPEHAVQEHQTPPHTPPQHKAARDGYVVRFPDRRPPQNSDPNQIAPRNLMDVYGDRTPIAPDPIVNSGDSNNEDNADDEDDDDDDVDMPEGDDHILPNIHIEPPSDEEFVLDEPIEHAPLIEIPHHLIVPYNLANVYVRVPRLPNVQNDEDEDGDINMHNVSDDNSDGSDSGGSESSDGGGGSNSSGGEPGDGGIPPIMVVDVIPHAANLPMDIGPINLPNFVVEVVEPVAADVQVAPFAIRLRMMPNNGHQPNNAEGA